MRHSTDFWKFLSSAPAWECESRGLLKMSKKNQKSIKKNSVMRKFDDFCFVTELFSSAMRQNYENQFWDKCIFQINSFIKLGLHLPNRFSHIWYK